MTNIACGEAPEILPSPEIFADWLSEIPHRRGASGQIIYQQGTDVLTIHSGGPGEQTYEFVDATRWISLLKELEVFTENDLIHSYTRKEALADGSLVPLPAKLAAEAGIVLPAAITFGLWAELNPPTHEQALGQSLEGRLWDLLMVFRAIAGGSNDDRLRFPLAVYRDSGTEAVGIVAVCGPADDGSPCLTFMLPGDD